MALIDDISSLRSECLAALDASHNYYGHTKSAWRLVQQLVRQGQTVTIQNQVTGNTVNESELAGLAQTYVTGYLASATFQHFVSLFERFIFDFLQAWLTEYPGSLSATQLQLRTVLDAADKQEIIVSVVRKEILGLAYKRVPEWFAYMEKVCQLGCPTHDQIVQLAEIKASRDVLVHNGGIANLTYINKSMGFARFASGETLDLPEHYHRDSWQLLKHLVSEIGDRAIQKLSKS